MTFAVLAIPNFSLHAVLRHEPELHSRPVALLADDSKKARISQVNELATGEGLTAGMTSTQAKARCPGIVFRVRSPQQEGLADEILLECAYQSAAFIEATAPGVCTLDLRGLSVGREGGAALERWARQAIERLGGYFLPARAGVAAAPGLACLAARAADPFLQIENAEKFWKTLPISELSPPEELREVLSKWGIATAGQFFGLGKDRIAERLGRPGLELFEAARSDKPRPLKLTSPKQIYEEFFEFEEAIETLEPLLFMVRRFLDQLARRMEPRRLAIEKLVFLLVLESGERHSRVLEIPAPNREVDVLFRIVHNYLENLRTSSAVKALGLEAKPCAEDHQQFQLFETAVRDPNKFFETIGRLQALLGPERVGSPRVEATHRPDALRMEPVTSEKLAMEQGEMQMVRGLMLRRFRPPLPATVRLRETTPIFVSCDRFNSSIEHSAGPWRSSGNWWENDWIREEWDVQTRDGGLYRLLRDSAGWFVEGSYD